MKEQFLPRYDLREPAFRKYEKDIATIATRRELKIPFTKMIEMGVKPATYRCRFRDALLGFKKFGYKSSLIPAGVRLDSIVLHETIDGGIFMENSAVSNEVMLEVSSSWETIISLCEQITKGSPSMFKVKFTNNEERERLNALQHYSSPYDIAVEFDDEVMVAVVS